MDQLISSIIAQLPVVGVFLLYSYFTDKARAAERKEEALERKTLIESEAAERKVIVDRYEASLESERKSREFQGKQFIDALTRIENKFSEVIKELEDKMNSYDKKFDQAVAVMQERTGSNRGRKVQ